MEIKRVVNDSYQGKKLMEKLGTAVVYSDVNLNIIDGSSIWTTSIVHVLAELGYEVRLVSKFPITDDRLTGVLRSLEGVVIDEPDSPLNASKTLSTFIERVCVESDADALIVRGFEACFHLSKNATVASLLWCYITDVPFPPWKISKTNRNRLQRIATVSRRMLAQTESSRSYLESLAPAAAGKTVLLPPMIPDDAFVDPESLAGRTEESSEPLKLVYAGKFALDWRTLEMLELPRVLRKLGVNATLTVIGDKINASREDPSWASRMRASLESHSNDPESGVIWLGGLPREETVARLPEFDIGLGWRTRVLDSSLEVSTKALEYAAAGVLPLINRTADHEALFGSDFAGFVSGDDDTTTIAKAIARLATITAGDLRDIQSVARNYSRGAVLSQLRMALARPTGSFDSKRLLISSHDLKFMGELMDSLESTPGVSVEIDPWETLHRTDEVKSRKRAQRSDVILCEFAGPSLLFHQKNKPENTRLIARLHGFELGAGWLDDVNWEEVDKVVFVSEHYRRKAIECYSLDLDRTVVIPNIVDCSDFDRPKTDGSSYTLGLVGYVPFLKRPDRALDVLEKLLSVDDRYILRLKGRLPWEYPYVWKDPIEKQQYLEFFNRIAIDKKLKEHVVFDSFSPDVANWHRGIGYLLSPSNRESFHLATAEAMAAGSLPLIWEREGARDIFGDEFVYPDTDSVAAAILEYSRLSAEELCSRRSSVKEYAGRWNRKEIIDSWYKILFD